MKNINIYNILIKCQLPKRQMGKVHKLIENNRLESEKMLNTSPTKNANQLSKRVMRLCGGNQAIVGGNGAGTSATDAHPAKARAGTCKTRASPKTTVRKTNVCFSYSRLANLSMAVVPYNMGRGHCVVRLEMNSEARSS